MLKQKLLGVQWYPLASTAVLHIVDSSGKRIYEKMKNPTYDFYMSETNSSSNIFYLPKEELVKHIVPYNFRYFEIAKLLKFPKDLLKGDGKMEGRAQLMADPRLFFADNTIEYEIMNKWTARKKAAGLLDETIEGKRVYFDIETHAAASYDTYIRLTSFVDKSRADFIETDVESPRVETVLAKFNIIESTKQRLLNANSSLKDPILIASVLFIAKYHSNDEEYQILQQKVKNYTFEYKSMVGVIDEEIANDRVDAISTFDDRERIFYVHFLNIFEDMKEEYWDKVDDPTFLSRYTDFINLYNIKVLINNDGKVKKKFPTEVAEFLALFDVYSKKGEDFNDDITRLRDLIELFRETGIELNEDIVVEFRMFTTESALLLDFLHLLKTQIEPDYLIAHNNKYDILTIVNRLQHLGHDALRLFQQFELDLSGYENGISAFLRVDRDADRPKKDNSYLDVPGIICLDTLLMTAKSSQREMNFSLDALSVDFLNDSKFKYDAKGIQYLYSSNTDHYIKYSMIDVLLLKHLDDALGLVTRYQVAIDNSWVSWSKYGTPSPITFNSLKKVLFEEFGLVMANNKRQYINNMRVEPKESLAGA